MFHQKFLVCHLPNELTSGRDIKTCRPWSQIEAFDILYVFQKYTVVVCPLGFTGTI
jgi:hypothetical protein